MNTKDTHHSSSVAAGRRTHQGWRALAATLVVIVASATTPVLADDRAEGASFEIALAGFPDRVYLGTSLSGTLTVQVYPDGSSKARRAIVETYVHTPAGPAVLGSRTLSVVPGEVRILEVEHAIAEDARTGPVTFGVRVTIGGETLWVEHEVYILGGK